MRRKTRTAAAISASHTEREWLSTSRLIGAVSVVWLLIVHSAVILLSLRFYGVPNASLIRPMGYGFNVLLWSIAAVPIAPVAVVALYFRRRSLWAWTALVLTFTPFPLARAIFHDAQTKQGFLLEE